MAHAVVSDARLPLAGEVWNMEFDPGTGQTKWIYTKNWTTGYSEFTWKRGFRWDDPELPEAIKGRNIVVLGPSDLMAQHLTAKVAAQAAQSLGINEQGLPYEAVRPTLMRELAQQEAYDGRGGHYSPRGRRSGRDFHESKGRRKR